MGGSRTVKLTVEYEGTDYHGWQSQRDRPSVQAELERAVARVVDHPVVIHGSGRTDRGVHALGQVASFETSSTVPAEKILLGTNTYLPEDIRVRSAEDAPPGFHARYSARGKRYRYAVLRSRIGAVLIRRYTAAVSYPLDVEAMRRGAAHFRGVHDFRAFEGNQKRRPPAAGDPPRSTVRTVAAVAVREAGPFLFIDAFGRGFLYGMVRTMVGTLLEVGQGRRIAEEVGDILRSRDRREAGFTAPARGLCLLSVYYEESELDRAVESLLAGGVDPDVAARDHELFLKTLL